MNVAIFLNFRFRNRLELFVFWTFFCYQKIFFGYLRSSSAHSFGVSVLQPGVDAQAAVIEGGGSVLGLTMLKDYPIYWRCRIAQRQISSIEHSLIPLGSVQLVLLLFAQV